MKNFIYFFILLLLMAGGAGIYVFNKAPENIENKSASLTVSAFQLFNDFSTDENKANAAYLDKVIEVQGKVKDINDLKNNPSMVLSSGDPLFGINCKLYPTEGVEKIQVGDSVSIKGLCTGMLSDVVLIKCTVEKVFKK